MMQHAIRYSFFLSPTFHTENFSFFTLFFYCISFHWFVCLFICLFVVFSCFSIHCRCLSLRTGIVLATTEGRETKKRTTLARLLKGLKTVNRRDRTNNQNTHTQVRVSKNKHIILSTARQEKETKRMCP